MIVKGLPAPFQGISTKSHKYLYFSIIYSHEADEDSDPTKDSDVMKP